MIIHMIPRRASASAPHSTLLLADGERLAVNGDWTDFSALEEGGSAEHDTLEDTDKSLIRRATRIDGVLHVTVMAELGPEFQSVFAPPDDPRWTVDVTKGLVSIPGNPIAIEEDE